MKKLFLILPVMALAACNQEPQTLISGCEQIGADEYGAIYKCPITEELVAIQESKAPDAMFRSDCGVDVAEIAKDTEHVYVNLDKDGKCEGEGTVMYRVMVKNPTIDGKAMYTVVTCK